MEREERLRRKLLKVLGEMKVMAHLTGLRNRPPSAEDARLFELRSKIVVWMEQILAKDLLAKKQAWVRIRPILRRMLSEYKRLVAVVKTQPVPRRETTPRGATVFVSS